MEIVPYLRSNYRYTRQRIKKVLDPDPEFTKRILHRYDTFWSGESKSKKYLPLLFAEDPLHKWQYSKNWQRVLSNKHNSREFAKKYECRVPKLYWEGKDIASIKFENLPERYVIKPAIGTCSKGVFLMFGEENLFDEKKYSSSQIIASLKSAQEIDPNLEFIIEEFLRNEQGEYTIPDDYKIYTFNGQIACIRVINRQGRQKGTGRYYDENWNLIPSLKTSKYIEGKYQDPPACLVEMIKSARKLSKACGIFIRIDFYATIEGAVFGEFATTPSHGIGYSKSGSDFLMKYWDRNCKGMM